MPIGEPGITIEDRDDYLAVVLPAYRHRDHFLECIAEGLAAAMQHPRGHVLVDNTATKRRLSVSDVYDLGRMLAEQSGALRLRIALVSARESVYPDRFFETVAANRGLSIRLFVEDFDAAIEWLNA